ncbi:MAG: ATP-binding protein [Clostridia bacterium]
MKQKVAIAATLLTLVLCFVFLFVVAGTARNVMDENTLDQIASICRLSANQLDSAAFDGQDGYDALKKVAVESGVMFSLYAKTGETTYTNRPHIADSLSSIERKGLEDGKVHTFTRVNPLAGGNWLYAARELGSGDFLCVATPAYALRKALGDKMLVLCLLAFAVALMVFVLMGIANERTNRVVGSVMRVLGDFSEGEYDSRLTGEPGDSILQVARLNEILGRIQDQVFRQKTRNQALSTVLNCMQSGILAVDAEMNVILVTPVGKQLLGISGSSEGLPIQVASKNVKLDSVLTEAMKQDGVYMSEVTARAADGRGYRPIRLYVSPMMKDRKAVGAVALIEDISELRRLEQVRTDFAANVSHELKTPLTSIKGFVETLQNGALENPAMAQKFLRIIMIEADRLTRLINDILTVSKLESGEQELPTERIRLDEMAEDVADMLRILASEKQVNIYTNRAPEPSFIIGNPDRVEQMLINLIENAIKYNKNGGSVTVSIFNSEDTINMSISDTGIGIPEENVSRLFERFYRVDKGRSRSMGGTGLGLSIVKHIVKSMGGMIEVHSKVNEGTEFLITLPRANAAEVSPVERQLDAQDE